jgi:hypothetical protein
LVIHGAPYQNDKIGKEQSQGRHWFNRSSSIQNGHGRFSQQELIRGGLARMMTAGLAVDVGLARLVPVARTLGLKSPSRVSTLASLNTLDQDCD